MSLRDWAQHEEARTKAECHMMTERKMMKKGGANPTLREAGLVLVLL